jgi:hypothetical protein
MAKSSRSDLGQAGTGIFFKMGLDRANQWIGPFQQVAHERSDLRGQYEIPDVASLIRATLLDLMDPSAA